MACLSVDAVKLYALLFVIEFKLTVQNVEKREILSQKKSFREITSFKITTLVRHTITFMKFW